MKKFLRNRGLAAVVGSFMLVLGSGSASAETSQTAGYSTAVAAKAPVVSAAQRAVSSTTSMFSNAIGSVFGTGVMQDEATRIVREAAWLHRNGWPLYALVDRYSASEGPALDEEANCIAVAVYHEARGESLEGQLAVARVIMNRAASGKYPPTWCGTVKQPWQFSFVRNYQFPYTDTSSLAWRKAVAITRLAISNAVPSLSGDVLWYHADYVAPSWGRRLTRVDKIGTHIFYRA
ncbi:MAG TPA: cell wall hydrolase [Sphingomicrobium sp.]|nr:cell wall hydrolase [Sphingomicrobium sp.]